LCSQYLTAANYDFAYDKRHSVRPKRNVRMAMQTEVAMYAACQKDERGLDKVVEDGKYRMKRYGVTPNLMVIPPQLSLYMALAPDEKISYKEGGPTALAAFEAGAAGFETRAFRGCGIVTSDPFEVSDEQEAVQMLERFTQVGEFYVMTPPEINADGEHFNYMDIVIYDEEKDRHVKIGFRKALLATGLFVPNPADADKLERTAATKLVGAAGDQGVTIVGDGATTLVDWAGAAANLEERARTGLKPASPAQKDVSIVISRPFIEHAMLSAVLTVSGGDTGATVFGPSDMQISVRCYASNSTRRIQLLFELLLISGLFVLLVRVTGQHVGQDHRRPLHRPLQGDGLKTTERARAPRCDGQRLPHGLRHQVLWQGLQYHQTAPGRSPDEPRGRAGRAPVAARLPNADVAVRRRPHGHGHVRHVSPSPVGDGWRRRPHVLPRRR